MSKTLLLNSTYEPIGFITYKKAFKLICNEKVEILSTWETTKISSISTEYIQPSVLKLKYRVRNLVKVPRFSRIIMFNRDNWICAYCGVGVDDETASIDHIHPKSKGGKTSWLNCVTACKSCNKQKGNIELENFEKRLLITPKIPSYYIWNQPKKEEWHPEWNLYSSI